MRSRILIPAAVFLAACGGAASVTNNALAGAADAQRNSGKPDAMSDADMRGALEGGGAPGEISNDRSSGDWVGSYSGMQIGAAGANRYSIYIDIGAPGCGGSIEGIATGSGDRLTMTVPPPVQGNYRQCRLTLDRRGNSIHVTSAGDCYLFHGAQCEGFDGDYARDPGSDRAVSSRNNIAAAPRGQVMMSAGGPAVPAGGTSAIEGSWVLEGGYCASGDPIAFLGDGTYDTSESDVSGRWSMSGNTLTIRYSEIDPMTGAAVGPQQRVVYRFTPVNANEMRLDNERYRRCPSNGGPEPWHPGRRFSAR